MAWVRFKKKDMPGGLWLKCPACGEVIYKKDLEAKMKVCPKCDHHHTLSGLERVRYTLDDADRSVLNFRESAVHAILGWDDDGAIWSNVAEHDDDPREWPPSRFGYPDGFPV